MEGFPGLEPLNLGGAFNTGLSWKELFLYAAGTTIVAAGVGGMLCGVKKHSELKAVPKSMDPDLQTLMMNQQRKTKRAPSRSADPSSAASSAGGYNMQAELEAALQMIILAQQQGKHLEAAEYFIKAADLVVTSNPQYAVQFYSSALQEYTSAGRYDLARHHLERLPPIGANNDAQIAHELQLARFSMVLEDSKALEYLSKAEAIAHQTANKDKYLFTINSMNLILIT